MAHASSSLLETTVAIAGGGPAGVMLGYLLARQGIDVVVMEKHADFFRDFRGDTVHPSTLQLLHELGILGEFLKRPHQEVTELTGIVGDTPIKIADFTHLNVAHPAVVLMPQWDFLDFLSGEAKRYPNFHLYMNTEVTGIAMKEGIVTGLTANTPDGPLTVKARLSVACDGRHSTVRERAAFHVHDLGAPIDVFWFRISRRATDSMETFGRFLPGALMVHINRQEYWQCAYVIAKGSADAIRADGLDAFRGRIAKASPLLADRTAEIRDWEDVKLLSVSVDRLERWWRDGLLAIGDAAHAMSPVGGVGINLAIQDAVAAARILAGPLKRGHVGDAALRAVQKRREFPTRFTQRLQVLVHGRVLAPVLRSDKPLTPPWPLLLFNTLPFLRRIPARIVGMGVRPEHVGK